LNKSDDLADLASATASLKVMSWLRLSVQDIRGFRIENWSGFAPSSTAKF